MHGSFVHLDFLFSDEFEQCLFFWYRTTVSFQRQIQICISCKKTVLHNTTELTNMVNQDQTNNRVWESLGSPGTETMIKIKILIGVCPSVYVDSHLVILYCIPQMEEE